MLEKDQIDKDNIMQLLEWLYETEGRNALFWKPNIQSAKKLRQKYIQLTAAYEKDMSC